MGKSEVGIPDREHGLPWFRLRHWRTWDSTGYGGARLLEEEPGACPQSPGRSTYPQGTAAQVCDSADRCSAKVTVTGDSDKLGLFCIFSLNFSEAVLLWARGNRPLELNCLSPRIDLEVWLPRRCRDRLGGEAPWASQRTSILLYSRTCGKTRKVLLRGSGKELPATQNPQASPMPAPPQEPKNKTAARDSP